MPAARRARSAALASNESRSTTYVGVGRLLGEAGDRAVEPGVQPVPRDLRGEVVAPHAGWLTGCRACAGWPRCRPCRRPRRPAWPCATTASPGSCRSAPVGPTAFADPASSAAPPRPRARIAALTPNSTTETPASTMPSPDHRAEHQPGRPGHDEVADLPDQPQRPGQPGGRGQQGPGHRAEPGRGAPALPEQHAEHQADHAEREAERLPGRGVDAVHPTSLRGRGQDA